MLVCLRMHEFKFRLSKTSTLLCTIATVLYVPLNPIIKFEQNFSTRLERTTPFIVIQTQYTSVPPTIVLSSRVFHIPPLPYRYFVLYVTGKDRSKSNTSNLQRSN